MTIKEARVKYHKKITATLKRSRTIQDYQRLLDYFFDCIEKEKVENISIEDILEGKAKLKQEYSTSYYSNICIVIRQFMSFISQFTNLQINPAEIEVPATDKESYQPISEEDFQEMVQNILPDTMIKFRNKTLLYFLYATGVRNCELCNLTVDNLDMDRQSVTIKTAKGGRDRVVFFDDKTKEWLDRYLDKRENWAENKDLWISYRTKKGIGVDAVRHIVRRHRHKEYIKVHSFRHGFATRCLKAGMSLKYIQRLMGHKSIKSTQVYLHLVDNDLREVYNEHMNS